MKEALLLMEKHLIVKYGQSDLQYSTPPHDQQIFSKRSEHTFLRIMPKNAPCPKER